MNESNKDSSNELAEDRTDLAEDRTILANQRTFNSWIGTALGSLGLAVGLRAVFGETTPTWLAKATASIFIVLAIFLAFTAYRNVIAANNRLNPHVTEGKRELRLQLIVGVLCAGALAIGGILWAL